MTDLGFRDTEENRYRLFDGSGNVVGFSALMDSLAQAQIVLFGELHDHAVIHRIQLEVTEALFEHRGSHLILGAEMFEADNQLIVDEYLEGLILQRHLMAEAKVWDNFETDYSPLLDFAKDHSLRFIATNIPRRYANLVAREGLGALARLSEEARRSIAPLPITVDIETPGYKEMIGMGAGMGHGMQIDSMNLVSAQAVKDATMAHFIRKNMDSKSLFIHYNGTYHSQNYGGIYWYLKKAERALAVRTISTVEADSSAFRQEYLGLADFIIIVPQTVEEEEA